MRYTLEISEEQAEIIKNALEEYFRLRMNQSWDFADDICFEGFDYEKRSKEEFNERIELRNKFKNEFEKLLSLVHPMISEGTVREKTPEMLRAMDIWQVIRYKLWTSKHTDAYNWCVDSRKPMNMSNEPLPKMDRVKE